MGGDAGDLRKAGLSPGTSYYVRAKYRGEVPGEKVEVKTYPQTPLENGSLEGATVTRGTDSPGFFGADYGARYEWSGWGTLNSVSACYSLRTAYAFTSRSGCRPTSDTPTGEGNAIRVITLGYGGGGWAVPKKASIVNSIWELMQMTMVTELMVLAIALALPPFVFGIKYIK